MKIKLILGLLLIASLLLVSACQTQQVATEPAKVIETKEDASVSVIDASEDLSEIADDLDELNGMLGE